MSALTQRSELPHFRTKINPVKLVDMKYPLLGLFIGAALSLTAFFPENSGFCASGTRNEKRSAAEIQALLGSRQLGKELGMQSPISQIEVISSDGIDRVIYQVSNGRCTLRIALKYSTLAKHPGGPVFPTWDGVTRRTGTCAD